MNARKLASRLAERWALHLEFIRASLAREPEAPQAWRWQIRERVLTYLLTRYGSKPDLDWQPTKPLAPPAFSPRLDRTTAEPRPASTLGEHLHRIAEANDVPLELAKLEERLNAGSTSNAIGGLGRDGPVLCVFLVLSGFSGILVISSFGAEPELAIAVAIVVFGSGALVGPSIRNALLRLLKWR